MAKTTIQQIEETEQELESVKNAIATIRDSGQSVDLGDMSYTEADINALMKRETQLRKRLSRLNGSRPAALPVNFNKLIR